MIGAIIFGSIIGWSGGKIHNTWKADEHVDFTFSLALAIIGFVVAESYLLF